MFDLKKEIEDYIYSHIDDYFLLLEDENKILIVEFENWLREEIEDYEDYTEEDIQDFLKECLIRNSDLIQLKEDIEIEKFLIKAFGFYYTNNKEEVKRKFLSGELKAEYKDEEV